jgi:hypothetical protein
MASAPPPAGTPPVPEPPPPLGSWARFYVLVAVVHIAVVAALIAFSSAYGVPAVPR